MQVTSGIVNMCNSVWFIHVPIKGVSVRSRVVAFKDFTTITNPDTDTIMNVENRISQMQ